VLLHRAKHTFRQREDELRGNQERGIIGLSSELLDSRHSHSV
jgi:hypothetical protein